MTLEQALAAARAYVAADSVLRVKDVVSAKLDDSLGGGGRCWSFEYEIDWGPEKCDPETLFVEVDVATGRVTVPPID
jgi:hypothetical protein